MTASFRRPLWWPVRDAAALCSDAEWNSSQEKNDENEDESLMSLERRHKRGALIHRFSCGSDGTSSYKIAMEVHSN